ncbi:MAG: high frequency lysogenization protein [Bermanella sp.]|jgi:high frequency lysogenization protein
MSNKSPESLREQVLALAGLCQSVSLVDSIARTGNVEPEPFEACLNSLVTFSATDTAEAYGGAAKMELGLRRLNDLLSGRRSQSDRELARYIIGATHLQRILEKQPEVAAIIRSRLEHSANGMAINGNSISELSPSIAAIYKDTVSHFKFRIKVNGSAQQLQNEHNADRIRAMLMASIRAAYLWRQHGGRRSHFLFKKGAILRTTRDILQGEIPH